MASRPEPIGTEGNKRSRSRKTWKGFSLKSNFYVTTLVLFLILLAVKIIISGIFLTTSSLGITSADVVMAQEVTEVPPKEEQNIDAIKQSLKKREMALSEKEAELKKMESELLPLKEEINTRMAELNDLQNSLTAEAKKLAEKEKAMQDAKITHLVKLYSSMEAGKAAAILNKLNIETVVRILGNMKGKAAGGILAMMTPDKGAIISERLSRAE